MNDMNFCEEWFIELYNLNVLLPSFLCPTIYVYKTLTSVPPREGVEWGA